MSKGSYTDFRDAMRAFESGWDRDRYESGRITESQLDEWGGGPVTDRFPDYASWGDLTDAEWNAMSYQSMNALGFVGYQFGEALLIDLEYYEDDQFYGNGASTNTWDGTWTGKNGATSLDAFMTAEVQEQAIQEAFGFNLKIIEENLAYSGQSLDNFIGTTTTYLDNGVEVSVTLTLTGIMAAAHLRGAFGTLSLLQNGAVSQDEYGTSILKYIDQFGGYDAPNIEDAIAVYLTGTAITDDNTSAPAVPVDPTPANPTPVDQSPVDPTPAEPAPTPTEPAPSIPPMGGSDVAASDNPAITAQTADVVITWDYGSDLTIADFDPAQDTIFIDWIAADAIEITQTNAGVVISVASNSQSTTLAGVTLADLQADNIHANDTTTRAELAGLVGKAMPDGMDGMPEGGEMVSDDNGMGHGNGDRSHMGGDAGDHDHGNMAATMYEITAASPAAVVDMFDASVDMIHIEADVTGTTFAIFEESGDALGTTVRIELTSPEGETRQVVFTDLALSDLTVANFSIADADVQAEVFEAIGATVTTPGGATGGYTLIDDTDGSNPARTNGTTDDGGTRYVADTNADDIVGFDPATDALDFGGTSVHGMIVTKAETGEIVIDSPWSDAAQIVQGTTFADVTIESFGVVGNEHFRQDIGGVLSWEQGVGPRDAATVYVRSHEYGVSEVVDNFDPATMTLSFLYFGTRERLSVENVGNDLVISSLPTGQSLTLTGVQLEDLIPGRVEFHHDQVIEDNLESPFGFAQDDVTLVDRTMLLTPEAPVGGTTDGFQTRTGDMTGSSPTNGPIPIVVDPAPINSDPTDGMRTDPAPVAGNPVIDPADPITSDTDGAEVVTITYDWGAQEVVDAFDAADDVIDFKWISQDSLSVTETETDLVFEVLENGGRTITLSSVQAEDLTSANFTAEHWNDILNEDSALISQLSSLGFSDLG